MAELSLHAPSAGFTQGVHLLIVSGNDLDLFWEGSGARQWFGHRSPGVLAAPYVIMIFGDRKEYLDRYSLEDKRDLGFDKEDRWQTPYWLVDAGMVAQNMLLLAQERDWGALFFGVDGDQQAYFTGIGVPTTAHCIGAVALGYRSRSDTVSGSPVVRQRRPMTDLVHLGTWS